MGQLSSHASRVIGGVVGERFPYYYVTEYPKAGGTWFGKMVADVLQIPYPEWTIFPAGCSAVLHNHWRYDPKLQRVFYLYRDGRDVMVSFFFHRMRSVARGFERDRRRYERLFGKGYDPSDVRSLLPRFIEEEFTRPRDARLNWAQHIDSWFDPDNRPQLTCLSYEQLRFDCEGTLKWAIERASGKEIDDWFIETAASKFSFVRQTGRKPGEEDRSSFIRKGAVGDWVNHFTREAAEVFDDLAGETLIRLGYETNHAWVKSFESNGPRPISEVVVHGPAGAVIAARMAAQRACANAATPARASRLPQVQSSSGLPGVAIVRRSEAPYPLIDGPAQLDRDS